MLKKWSGPRQRCWKFWFLIGFYCILRHFYIWNSHGFNQSLFYFISSDRLIILIPDSKNKNKILGFFFLFYRPPDSAKMVRNWLEYHKIKRASPSIGMGAQKTMKAFCARSQLFTDFCGLSVGLSVYKASSGMTTNLTKLDPIIFWKMKHNFFSKN